MNYIIITGASRGLGRALSLKLSDGNTKVYLVARSIKVLKEVSIDIKNKGGHSEPIEFDFSEKLDRIANLVDAIIKDVDLNECSTLTLINNAGLIKPIDFIGNLNIDDILLSLNTNCTSTIVLINEFIKKTRNLKCTKKVINITSGVVFNPLGGWSLYSASKSAVNNFLETLALEQENNVKVVCFDPGVMDTDIQGYIRNVDVNKFPYIDKFIKYYNQGELRSPTSVANKIKEIYIDDWKAKYMFEKIKDYE